MTNKRLPTIKAEYMPGGARRQELLDKVPVDYLRNQEQPTDQT